MQTKELIKAMRRNVHPSDEDFLNVRGDLLKKAADALEATLWRDDVKNAPTSKIVTQERVTKGKKMNVSRLEPVWFWVQTKCGQVMQSYLMESGRFHGLATDELPIAWMPNPKPLAPPEAE